MNSAPSLERVAVTTTDQLHYPPLDLTNNLFMEHMFADVLQALGLDAEHAETPQWNPMGALVPPGARIVIKPNWVLHENPVGGLESLVTHPSVVAAALDLAAKAEPREIILGDAPIQDCDFNQLMDFGYQDIVEAARARGIPVTLKDFRRTTLSIQNHTFDIKNDLRPISDYTLVNLGRDSLIEPISADAGKFRVTKYDPRVMREHHRPGKHEYLITRDVLEADLIINLPKLKTHKKAGMTAALKNLVGINGNKDYLPHHRKGPSILGGDNYKYPSPFKLLAEQMLDFENKHLEKKGWTRWINRLVYYLLVAEMKLGGTGDVEGSWYGNDTVWRMCLDLNRILLHAHADGTLSKQPVRKELSIVDAIIAGDGDGPLKPGPVRMGAIVAALNPAASDWVSAHLMGFDPNRIPIVNNAFIPMNYPIAPFSPEDIHVMVNNKPVDIAEARRIAGKHFTPPRGWKNHIESND